MMIFKDQNSSYPIARLPDNIPGFFYRTSGKGRINSELYVQYFKERGIFGLSGRRYRIIFMDNCSAH